MSLLKNFWYIACESKELKPNSVISRKIFGEWLALFRDEEGVPVALQDRCLHRSTQLSKGSVKGGILTCPYHGWRYNGDGEVVFVPSEGPTTRKRCASRFHTIEQDDYIYVCLVSESVEKPFPMPCYKAEGYTTIRLQNLFANTVVNCAENFVDIPHTTFVHPTIFRNARQEKMAARVERKSGAVKVTYEGEKSDFGIFSWFLNPKKSEVRHTDEYLMPNITTVNYWFGGGKHFIITSQSVPVGDRETLVYTDLTYNYGIWNWPSRPIVRRQAQAIIDQDVEILGQQNETLQKYGAQFQNSPCDLIHTMIESIYHELESGRDPRALPDKQGRVEFWV